MAHSLCEPLVAHRIKMSPGFRFLTEGSNIFLVTVQTDLIGICKYIGDRLICMNWYDVILTKKIIIKKLY